MGPERWLRIALLRLRSMVRSGQVERELDDELRHHLDRQIAAHVARGLTPAEARTAALRAIGRVQARKEEMRDAQGISLLRDFARDLKYGVRVLARSPVFAVTSILSLGLGIGANTAMFTAVDALMLKRLPVREADALVLPTPAEGVARQESIPYPRFELVAERMVPSPYVSAAAIWTIDRSNLTVDPVGGGAAIDDPSLVKVGLASGDYFSTMGVAAIMGRTFTRDDNRAPGGHPIAVISHAFWQHRVDADPRAIGRTIRLNGVRYEIVGVTPADFTGEWVGMPTDLWVPFMMASQVMPEVPGGPGLFPSRVVARLAPGLSREQAQAQATPMYRQISHDDHSGFQPPDREERIARTVIHLDPGARGYSPQRDAFAQSFAILMAGVAVLLMITCANLANLLLARGAARQRELALRLAIGAGRGRLIRQFLTESSLIAIGGWLAGLVVAIWATQALAGLFTTGPVALNGQGTGLRLPLALDLHALAFAGAVCLFCSLLIGVAPALGTRKVGLAQALRDSSARVIGGRQRGPSATLLVAQVALSLVLVVGAGLFLQTLRNLKASDLGMERSHELFIWTVPGQTGRQDDAVAGVWKESQDRLSALPGVVAVGAANQAVLNGGIFTPGSRPGVALIVEGDPPKPTASTGVRVFITPRYFESLGVPFLAGRDFTERDTETAPLTVIINEAMAHFYFGSAQAAIGRRVRFLNREQVSTEIVGVVKDYVRGTPRGTHEEFNTYFSYRHPEALNRGAQSRLRIMMLALRTQGDPLTRGHGRTPGAEGDRSAAAHPPNQHARAAAGRRAGAGLDDCRAVHGLWRTGDPARLARALRPGLVSGRAAHHRDRRATGPWLDSPRRADADSQREPDAGGRWTGHRTRHRAGPGHCRVRTSLRRERHRSLDHRGRGGGSDRRWRIGGVHSRATCRRSRSHGVAEV